MMKLLLLLSLVLNLVLGYFLMFRKPEKEVVERLIIETHPAEALKDAPPAPAPAPAPIKEAPKKKSEPQEFVPLETHELQDAGEKMETDRFEFLTETLGMSEDKIAKHNQIRDEFYKQTAQFWKKNPMRELTFKERRLMLEMEEELYEKLEKLHGKKNWERYQKFREEYNQQGHKKQVEDNRPFIFMGL